MVTLNEIDYKAVNVKHIEEVLQKYFAVRGDYTISDRGIVSGDNFMGNFMLDKLPVQFGHVNKFFSCSYCGLTTLAGSPCSVGGDFECFSNKLKTLVGGPDSVGGHYVCLENYLTDLHGMVPLGQKWFNCRDNPLQTLDGLIPCYLFRMTCEPDLPLLRLLQCGSVTFQEEFELAQNIMNKYCNKNITRSAILQCQKELIVNGFEGIASW